MKRLVSGTLKIDKDVVESDTSSREEVKVVHLLDPQENPYQTERILLDINSEEARPQGDTSLGLNNDNDPNIN